MEVKTLTYECWGDTIQPITIYFANVCFLFAFCLPGRHVNVQLSPTGWERLVEGFTLPYADFQASYLFLTPFSHSCLWWYLELPVSEPLLGSAGSSFLSCLLLCVSFATASAPFSSVTTPCPLLSLLCWPFTAASSALLPQTPLHLFCSPHFRRLLIPFTCLKSLPCSLHHLGFTLPFKWGLRGRGGKHKCILERPLWMQWGE